MLNIEYFPESEVLLKVAEKVSVFDDKLVRLAHEMIETMWAWDGVGLAAPQVGVSQRLFVASLRSGQASIFINPKFTFKSEATDLGDEGCISMPGLYGKVVRHSRVIMEFQDIDGEKQKVNVAGLAARVLQHEFDHLDGWLFPFYKIPGLDRDSPKRPPVIKPFDYKALARLEMVQI